MDDAHLTPETGIEIAHPDAGAPPALHGPPPPLPGPDDDVRPRMGGTPGSRRYFQGDKLPVTSSVLISNSKYLNNPYYREAFATQALRRHGHDLPTTYMVPISARAIEEVTDADRKAQLVEEEKLKNPEFAEWLAERRYSDYTLESTAEYGPGTFGREIHELLKIPGVKLDFTFAEKAEVMSDVEYMARRSQVSHDLEHIITGFGPNTAGENALGMVNVTSSAHYFTPELAQLLTHGIMWVATTGLYRTALHYHHVLPTYLDAMQQGIKVGLSIKRPLFMTPWEDYLDWRLEDIAAHLGIERGPGDVWGWTTEASCG